MDLAASRPVFAAGAGVWAAALALISAAREFPVLVRATGAMAAVPVAIAAARMFLGARLTAPSAPLPFGASPFLALILRGWAWAPRRTRPARNAEP
jgi:hypothetical protein